MAATLDDVVSELKKIKKILKKVHLNAEQQSEIDIIEE